MSINLRRIYFPLRSNAGWFQNIQLRDEIEFRLKLALFFYDEVLIEDGTYEGTVWENTSFDMYIPSSQAKNRIISIENDTKNIDAGLWIQPKGPNTKPVPLVTGQTIARYKIDYYEFLQQINLAEHDFIKLVAIPNERISKDAKSIIAQQTEQDQLLFSELEGNKFLKKLVFKNLNRDLYFSRALESGLVIDPVHSKILDAKSKESLKGCFLYLIRNRRLSEDSYH